MKFAGFVNLFILFYSQLNTFFAEFIIAFFCPTSWVILKQLDPLLSRATDQWPIPLHLMDYCPVARKGYASNC